MANQTSTPQSSSIFVSYSRKDKEFARRLNDALDAGGFTAWVDWEGIAPSADWRDEIRHAIQGADALVFVLSPDSVKSKECAFELKCALEYNKKLIPVVYRPVPKGVVIHKKLAAANWIFMREQDKFKVGVSKIMESVRTDLGWVRLHTRLLQRALEWQEHNRGGSYLLQGSELEEAQRWMTDAASQSEREVLPLQAEFISSSRHGAIRRQRRLLLGVSLALVLSLALTAYALVQRRRADANALEAIANSNARATQQAIAESNATLAEKNRGLAEENAKLAQANEAAARAQRSAAQAQLYLAQPGQLDTSTLLSVASWQRDQTPQAENLLRASISLLPVPVAQMRQTDEITALEYTPDGASLISASLDGKTCVWTAAGEQRFCVDHDGDVNAAILARGGQVLATGSSDGSVRLWSMTDGSLLRRYDLGAVVYSLAASPDGTWLAAGRADSAISFFNLNAQREVSTLSMRGEIYALDFSQNSAWLAIGSSTGGVSMWRVMSDIWLSGPSLQGEVYNVAFSPDGRWLVASGSDGTARVALAEIGAQYYLMQHNDYVEALAFGPDSHWFATASDDKLARVWSLDTGQELLRLPHQDYVQEIKVSPDGRWIASTGLDNTARIWSSISGEQMLQVQLEANGLKVAFSPDNRRLAVGDGKGNLSIWNVDTLSAFNGAFEFTQVTHRVLFGPGGEWLAVNVDDRTVQLFDAARIAAPDGAPGTVVLKPGALTYDMAVSPDGRWIAVPEDGLNRVSLYDTVTGDRRVLAETDNVLSVGFSPDSKLLAMGEKNGTIAFWDVAADTRLYEISAGAPVGSLAFDPSGRWLASGLSAVEKVGRTALWDLATQKVIAELSQNGDIRAIAFSPNGRWLVTSGTGGGTYFWNAGDASFNLVYQLLPDVRGSSFSFHPTLPWMALGGDDAHVYLIDLDAGQEIARLPQATSVAGVSFSPDGRLLATAAGKVVKLWDVSAILLAPRQDLELIACSRLIVNLSHTQWGQLFFDEPYRLICPSLPEGGQ